MFPGVAKRILLVGANSGEISFYQLKTDRTTFFC